MKHKELYPQLHKTLTSYLLHTPHVLMDMLAGHSPDATQVDEAVRTIDSQQLLNCLPTPALLSILIEQNVLPAGVRAQIIDGYSLLEDEQKKQLLEQLPVEAAVHLLIQTRLHGDQLLGRGQIRQDLAARLQSATTMVLVERGQATTHMQPIRNETPRSLMNGFVQEICDGLPDGVVTPAVKERVLEYLLGSVVEGATSIQDSRQRWDHFYACVSNPNAVLS